MFISEKDYVKMKQELHRLKTSNDNLQHDCVIMLDTSREQREKIKDLENNIELLVNNSTDEKIKELVLDGQSNN